MKFTNVLKKIILEQSRLEVLMDKFVLPKKDKEGQTKKAPLTKDEFFELIQADPGTKLNDVNLDRASKEELSRVKVGGYTPWLIKKYLNVTTERQPGDQGYEAEVKQMKERFMEDLYKVKEDLRKFDRFKHKLPLELRNIDNLTPESLYDAVKDFDLTLATTTKAERKSAPVHPGAKLVFDGPTWRVIEIENKGPVGKEAACFYGGNNKETRWCTSTPGTDTWFNRYINKGPLYVLYKPSDTDVAPETGLPKERYQFHFPDNQFMDKDDRQQDLVKLLNGPMKELKDFFKPEFAKGLTTGGEKLVIDSFSHGAVGKFIGLYGIDDLMTQLPDTLKEIQIQNRDNNGVLINIPEEIGRFQNLGMIMFDNCIDRIPESICNLPKLRFLALPNNKELRTIPECIADLPNLYFLNLKGCPNVEIPKKIEETAFPMGDNMWDFGGK